MTPRAPLAAPLAWLVELARTIAPGSRGAWCRKRRHELRSAGRTVVWVRGPAVSWAEWGARRGYFEVQYMDGLAYLRPLGAPVA